MKIRVEPEISGKKEGKEGYDIIINAGIIGGVSAEEILSAFSSAAVNLKAGFLAVTSETVYRLYGVKFSAFLKKCGIENFDFIVLPDGESTKSLKYLADIHDRLIDNGMERSDYIIAFGGGVVGDLAGFAAATYLRGINFIQVPTTLLADVDSSVGGKTGIDHPKGKNLIGSFYQPRAVLIDVDILKTLDKRELTNGFAEVIKYGASLDADFFSYLESNYKKILAYDEESLIRIIEKSCSIKADIVNQDEKESGLRSVLNFGHSLGHAIETLYNYENIKHGEAIAIGMVFAAKLSKYLGLCGEEDVARIKNLIINSGLPSDIPDFTPEQYVNAMKLDKKVADKQIKFVLIKGIGVYEFKKLDFSFLFNYLAKFNKQAKLKAPQN